MEPHDDLWVTIMGDHGVGKSSLATVLTTGEFPVLVPTGYFCFSREIVVNDTYVQVGVDEFADDIRYRADASDFYDIDCIVLCFSVDVPGSFDSLLSRWIPLVKEFSPSMPLVVARLKTDLDSPEISNKINDDVYSEIVGLHYEEVQVCEYLTCSALTETGVEGLFQRAAKVGDCFRK
mmetsp:Transcript_122/g.162  ORF Transcript_122/g.162 Transcript_122/m.162 type:complete len:178 (+) Transcript_122:103-636(+)|eukprot:CAMPEP_0184043456 /NCGR_PEP_ID=MMETSP0955-20130417/66935_1 /TAXON_ID=627963 /ORGANISM="Aplanochytrium sp, Strain PBS07" /LENGTH=177 /DNA_ID=CAMNT_0026334369 /DNA_START=63 /DNA_END=596 /DNA_ORIENTATION=+